MNRRHDFRTCHKPECPGCRTQRRISVGEAILRVFEEKRPVHLTGSLVLHALSPKHPLPEWCR